MSYRQEVQQVIFDIFSKQVGNTFQEGLVDSSLIEEFDDRLYHLQPIWNTRESAYAPVSGPRFYNYFCQHQADVVRYHMRKDLREAAGLGSPPSIFTTNAAESINAALKRKVEYKESEWPNFNEHIRQFVECQREEVIRALSGRGQYRLCPEAEHYGVSTQVWMKMRPDQRQQVVQDFQHARPSANKE